MTSEETNTLTVHGRLAHHESLRLNQFLSIKNTIFINRASQRHLAEF